MDTTTSKNDIGRGPLAAGAPKGASGNRSAAFNFKDLLNPTEGQMNARSETEPRPSKLKSALRSTSALISQPYLVSNTILTLGAAIAVIGVLLGGGVSGHWESLKSGDPLALTLTLGSFTALLCGTMGLSMLADRREAAKREEQTAHEKQEATDLKRSLEHWMRELTYMQDELSDTINRVAARSNATWYHRPNNFKSWNALAPGSQLISIDGMCAGEMARTKDAEGRECLRADLEFLEAAWLPRFAESTALDKVIHLIGVWGEPFDQEKLALKAQKLMAAYRALQGVAEEGGKPIDLSTVEMVFFDGSLWTNSSVFLGTKRSRASENETHPFVQRYTSIPVPAAGPLNAEVEITYSSDLVAHYRSIANDLIDNAQRVLTIEEAEARFGQMVPKVVNSANRPIKLTSGVKALNVEIIDHGDGSFSL